MGWILVLGLLLAGCGESERITALEAELAGAKRLHAVHIEEIVTIRNELARLAYDGARNELHILELEQYQLAFHCKTDGCKRIASARDFSIESQEKSVAEFEAAHNKGVKAETLYQGFIGTDDAVSFELTR